MNGDILTDLNLKHLMKFHKSKEADLTVALKRTALHIPYGVVTIDAENLLESIDERPTLDFLISSGIYVISPKLLDLIPLEGMYPMTDLIVNAKENGMKVLGYPFDESWKDIGQLDDYIEAFHNGEDKPSNNDIHLKF